MRRRVRSLLRGLRVEFLGSQRRLVYQAWGSLEFIGVPWRLVCQAWGSLEYMVPRTSKHLPNRMSLFQNRQKFQSSLRRLKEGLR